MRCFLLLGLFAGCDQVYGLEGRGELGDLEAGIVAWYPMDSDDDLLHDASGNELNGICRNSRCPTPSQDGKVSGALHFDGMIQIGVNPDPLLETRDGFTVAGWYRIEQQVLTPVVQCPFNKVANGGTNSWQLCFERGGGVVFYSTQGDADGGTVAIGEYHHIVLWWDGTEKRIYVNGLMVGRMEEDTILFDDGIAAIGSDSDDNNVVAEFTGDMDDLRIYDRPLMVGEIQQLLELGSPP